MKSHDVINHSLILYTFPVAGTVLKRKKSFFDGQNPRNVWESEYTIVFKLTYGPKSVSKKFMSHTLFISLYDTNFFQACHAEHLRISV